MVKALGLLKRCDQPTNISRTGNIWVDSQIIILLQVSLVCDGGVAGHNAWLLVMPYHKAASGGGSCSTDNPLSTCVTVSGFKGSPDTEGTEFC